jgi:4-hydroxy-3-methylbut-2-enyl diphosphate reductase
MDKLKNNGLICIDEDAPGALPKDLSGSAVIIRAHGITPALEEELLSRGARLADATCPRVKSSQLKALAFAEKACRIFLAGEKHHAEIAGIQGYAAKGREAALAGGGNPAAAFPACVVVSTREEAEAEAEKLLRQEPRAKTCLLGQTTIPLETYRSIGEGLRKFFPDAEIINTICGSAPQQAMRELCARVDAVIVAGGRSSANTRRLLGIAQGMGKPAWLVETAAGLPPEIAKYPVVGLGAGASTPDDIINEVEEALRKL